MAGKGNRILSGFFALLLIFLFLAIPVRTTRISKDAAVYLLTANTHLKELRTMGIDSFSRHAREDWVNVSSWHCKPLLEFIVTPILGLGLGFAGIRAFFFLWFLLGGWITYLLFSRYLKRETAITATGLWVFCGSLLFYYTDLVPVSFFPLPFILLSVLFLSRFCETGSRGALLMAALGTGLTFTAHPATPPFVAVMAISVAYCPATLEKRIKNLLLFGAVSLVPLLAMHLFTVVWYGSLEGFQYVDGAPMTYFQQIFDHADTVNKTYRIKAAKMVLYRLVLKNGVLGVLMISGTVLYFLWSLVRLKGRLTRREGFDLMAFSVVFVALNVLFFLWTNPKERHFFQSLPFIALLGVEMLHSLFKRKAWGAVLVGIYAVTSVTLVYYFADYKMRYEKVTAFFTERKLEKNVVVSDHRPMLYTVYGFRVYGIEDPVPREPRKGSLYAVIWGDEPLPEGFREIGVEKVGEMNSGAYYTRMARNLYRFDPLARLILYAAKQWNPAWMDKFLFLRYNDNFRVYRFLRWPAVVPVTEGYRYEILDRHFRSNLEPSG
jgi:hypothetical protein